MPLIQQLSTHVADLIAAGEVVERPASVVKELLENSIDAGATTISVEIRGGGMESIRVSDNGCGIVPDELPTAFLRHATSKLRSENDLAAIGTLGFRGEALAAISAVARVDITSRQRGSDIGAALSLEGGVPGTPEEKGCPEGTMIVVRNLFYNTPARMKFMKKDSSESSAVSSAVQRLALSHPYISIRFIKDGEEQFFTPGDGDLRSAIYAAMGREFALSLTPVSGSGSGVSVSGFVTHPLEGRGARTMQHFFVNGRYVKSQTLSAAVEEAYRNQLMKGRFPGCVLHITVPLDSVDVNVHPAKTVVKFLREHDVFDAVYHAVLSALDEGHEAPLFKTAPPPSSPSQSEPSSEQTSIAAPRFVPSYVYGGTDSGFKTAFPAADSELGGAKTITDFIPPLVSPTPQSAPEHILQVYDEPGGGMAAPWRIAGEVLNTYIVAEDEERGTVWFIDKHAAHERVNFNRLKSGAAPVMTQELMSPLTVTLSPESCSALIGQLQLLEKFGFSVEDFGGSTLLVRSSPAGIDSGDIAGALEEIADEIARSGSADPDAARDTMLRTVACKSAIKAGMHSDESELRVLVDKVQSGEIKFCPHGRPIAVKLTKTEIEKQFKRIV